MGHLSTTIGPAYKASFRWEYPDTGIYWYINAEINLTERDGDPGNFGLDVTLCEVHNQDGVMVAVYGKDFDPEVRKAIIDAVVVRFWESIETKIQREHN
jgi:hypothetical protein